MSDHALRTEFDRFRAHRRELTNSDETVGVRDATVREGAMLGVGLLIGGGFPGAAACLTVLLEARFPDVLDWPWIGGLEE